MRKPGSMERIRQSARASRPGGDQQHDRDRHLGDHQGGSQARLAAAAGPRTVAQGSQAAAADPPGGRDSESRGGERGDQRGETEDAEIDRGCLGDGQGVRHQPGEQRSAENRQQHAEQPAKRGQQQTLREELPHQPLPAGADGGAHGQLLSPRESPGQQQVGEIGAGDQQDAHRGRAQRGQQHAGLLRYLVAQREHGRAGVQVFLRILPFQLTGDG